MPTNSNFFLDKSVHLDIYFQIAAVAWHMSHSLFERCAVVGQWPTVIQAHAAAQRIQNSAA